MARKKILHKRLALENDGELSERKRCKGQGENL